MGPRSRGGRARAGRRPRRGSRRARQAQLGDRREAVGGIARPARRRLPGLAQGGERGAEGEVLPHRAREGGPLALGDRGGWVDERPVVGDPLVGEEAQRHRDRVIARADIGEGERDIGQGAHQRQLVAGDFSVVPQDRGDRVAGLSAEQHPLQARTGVIAGAPHQR